MFKIDSKGVGGLFPEEGVVVGIVSLDNVRFYRDMDW